MGLVTRPAKSGAGGITGFVAKVAAGFTKIFALDLDNDWIALADQVNGNLDENNVLDASLPGTKLTPTAGITHGQLALNADVATTDLAVGASVHARQTSGPASWAQFSTTETTLETCPSLSSRGGPVFVTGSLAMAVQPPTGTPANLTVRLYRDTTVIQTKVYTVQGSSGDTTALDVAIAVIDQPAAGSYVYKATAQISSGLVLATLGGGALFAVELA